MKHIFKLSLFIFGALMLFACEKDKRGHQFSGSNPSLDSLLDNTFVFKLESKGDTAKYQKKNLFKAEEDLLTWLGTGDMTKISLSYPVIDSFKNKSVKDSINAIVNELLLLNASGEIAYGSLEERAEDFIREFKKSQNELKSFGVSANWECDVQIDILLNTQRILAMRFYEMNYTGGAHPNNWTRYLNFDMSNGNIIELSDVFLPKFQEELLSIAERRFRKSQDIAPGTKLQDTPFEFVKGKFALPNNFALTRTGIRFCYNPYDIAPYSMGTIEFDLPYDDVLHLLNKKMLE